MRIKNLRGVSEVRFKKKLDTFTLETSKKHHIRNFLRNGRLRVMVRYFSMQFFYVKFDIYLQIVIKTSLIELIKVILIQRFRNRSDLKIMVFQETRQR